MTATESGFNELVYLAAAQERITTANRLYVAGSPDYVLATYLSGVAVECLFHAYRLRSGEDDTARHDLGRQADLGDFYNGMTRKQKQATQAQVSDLVGRWQNNHRYRSVEAMRDFVLRRSLYFVTGKTTTRLDVVQFNAERAVLAATDIVTIGV